MTDPIIEVTGAPVIYTDIPPVQPKPYNPLHRPPINYKHFTIALVIFVVAAVGISVLSYCFLPYHWLFSLLAWVVLYIMLIGKRAAIWMVHLYQNKAKDETRLRCVFEPSCSEYMILCLQKYGLVIGGIKGIKRLTRCHAPNGGKDYPYEI